jgi:hypothetical protein
VEEQEGESERAEVTGREEQKGGNERLARRAIGRRLYAVEPFLRRG